MINYSNNSKSLFKITSLIIIVLSIIPFVYPQLSYADTMKWGMVATPDSTHNVIVSPSEINQIVTGIDGSLYALDIPNNKVYKSINGGVWWDDITSFISGAALPIWNIALAPDNPNIMAVVASQAGLPQTVFFSSDGGNNWQNLNCPAVNNIGAIDISMNYGSYDIVIGTRAGGNGKILICKLANLGNWTDQGFTGDIIAAKFSPNYASDSSLIIVSATAAGSFINIGFRDSVANTTNWSSFTPVEITVAGTGTSPKDNQIKIADIETPIDFVGQSSALRRIYVSTDDGGITGNGGVYRLDDTILYKIMTVAGTKRISSISYYGTYNGGELLAGEVKSNIPTATVDIWYCLNPEANCPQSSCIFWQKATKPPTGGANSGNANAQVLWSRDGITAYCGTSSADLVGAWPNGLTTSVAFDESAFSVSTSGGKAWNQLSLIDTEITFIADVSTTLYSDTLYIASINTRPGYTGFDSVWRSINFGSLTTWERVFCVLTNLNDAILRMNLAKNDQVFLGVRTGTNLYWSVDKGQTWNDTVPGVTISDFSVAEINGIPYIHVLSNNLIRRGDYTGTSWKWGTSINSNISTGHTIFAAPTGVVVVGDTGGNVAYSTDNGAQYTSIVGVPAAGKIHVLTDYRIKNYLVIYAASDNPAGKIYGFVPGVTSQWVDMGAPGQSFYGIAQMDTFYGVWFTSSNSTTARTLSPEDTLRPQGGEWDTMQAGLTSGVAFTREPVSLKASGGVNLWAIDNRNYTITQGRLWNFSDGFASGPPAIISTPGRPGKEQLFQAAIAQQPVANTTISLDTKENIPNIEFRWNHPIPAGGYDLWIAADKDFNQVIFKKSIIPEAVMAPKYTLSPNEAPLEAGRTYYWKVRVNKAAITYERGEGIWSNILSFNIASKQIIPQSVIPIPVLQSPLDNAINISRSPQFTWTPITGSTEYQFSLAQDRLMQQIIITEKLNTAAYSYNGTLNSNTTYYWQVRVSKPTVSEPSSIFSFTVLNDLPAISPQQSTEFPIWIWIVLGILIAASVTIPIIIYLSTRSAKTKIR